ncbi:hypothetical protein F2Q69_00039209 [Brassica cretica]|uniref:Uncharacterized protein n=2 Tax=Brassica cretica TaxID=69181 RepID=A0A3N6Q5G4_BRACR|nr:hypothetical protein DY000_02043907 [Brassica cretica]KAF3604789.1 hypothetical protein F2Q69_00039209 [Brassica cretica]
MNGFQRLELLYSNIFEQKNCSLEKKKEKPRAHITQIHAARWCGYSCCCHIFKLREG